VEDLKKSVARIEEKLEKIADDQSKIKIVQVEQAADLKYHIARTDAAEYRIETIEERLVPVFELKSRIDGGFLLLGKIGTGLGLIFAAIKALETVLGML
jgi:hypothetical protein